MQEAILSLLQRHLTGQLRPSGGSNVLTKCPFHKGGQERRPSFSVNIEKGVFQCFTCQERGTIPWMLHLLGLSKDEIAVETAIIKPVLDRNRELHKIEKENAFSNRDPFVTKSTLPEAILGIYDWEPPLPEQFDRSILRSLEVGFDHRLQRITFPLRDMYGTLAGISGRATREGQIPRYQVYQGGRRDLSGRWIPGHFGDWFDQEYPGYVCENHDFLWNYHRIWQRLISMTDPSVTLIVVEGFKAAIWLIQNGFWNTVALMGSYISDRQQAMIHRFGGTVILMLDNDVAGRRAMCRVGDLLWEPMKGKIRVASYPPMDVETQPDSYGLDGLQHILGKSMQFEEFVHLEIRRGELQ